MRAKLSGSKTEPPSPTAARELPGGLRSKLGLKEEAEAVLEAAAMPSPFKARLASYEARVTAGLPLPPSPPVGKESRLARAGQQAASARALIFTSGDAPEMNFQLSAARLGEIATAMHEGITYGINANTASFDERAWEFWEIVCGVHGTSPLRTSEEARTRPERCAHLLAALMLYASAVCVPRTQGLSAIKPPSAMAYPLAIIRIFGRWGVQMPSYKLLRASLNYLSRLYVNYH